MVQPGLTLEDAQGRQSLVLVWHVGSRIRPWTYPPGLDRRPVVKVNPL